MKFLKKYKWIIGIVLLFLGMDGYLMFQGFFLLNIVPIGLLLAYIGLFYPIETFFLVVVLTPLSVDLANVTSSSFGMFIPTEPLLIELLFVMLFRQIQFPFLTKEFWKHPIVIATIIYMTWIAITCITSQLPVVSIKFLMMRSWYIIPLFLIGFIVFQKKKNISLFIWCYALPMTGVIFYTLIHHSMYGFGEDAAYWVMQPFFKDHTIYGAGVAISTVFVIGLNFYKKHSFQMQILLAFMLVVNVLGLYFSFTRGAWVSIIGATAVWIVIKLRIKFKYLVFTGLILGIITIVSWNQIIMFMDNNQHEHTADTFKGRLASASNITSDASNLERINRWAAAINMFEKRPFFGFGPGTYMFEYASFQDPDKITVISTYFGTLGNAHSEYLGPLAEMGILGLISILLFVTALFYCGIHLLVDIKKYFPEDKMWYTLILTVVLAMVTYFTHGVINNYLDSDKAAVPVFASAILIVSQQIILRKKVKELEQKEASK